MHMGGMQQIIKLGGELLQKLLLKSELKMNQILPPPPNPDTYPSHQKLKAGFRKQRMGGITNHLFPPPRLTNNAAPDPSQTSSRRDSSRTPPPPPDSLLSISISDLGRKSEYSKRIRIHTSQNIRYEGGEQTSWVGDCCRKSCSNRN